MNKLLFYAVCISCTCVLNSCSGCSSEENHPFSFKDGFKSEQDVRNYIGGQTLVSNYGPATIAPSGIRVTTDYPGPSSINNPTMDGYVTITHYSEHSAEFTITFYDEEESQMEYEIHEDGSIHTY